MPIFKIKTMRWGDPDKKSVIFIADTHEGNDMHTATAYSEESGLWDEIKTYDLSLIQPYEPPPLLEEIDEPQPTD